MCQPVHMAPALCCQEFPDRPSRSPRFLLAQRKGCMSWTHPSFPYWNFFSRSHSRVTWPWPSKRACIHHCVDCMCLVWLGSRTSVMLCCVDFLMPATLCAVSIGNIFLAFGNLLLCSHLALLDDVVPWINQHVMRTQKATMLTICGVGEIQYFGG